MKKSIRVHNVLDYLGRNILGREDKALLVMSLAPHVSQDELDAFLSDWEIDKAPVQSVILLAHLMKTHPSLSFPEKIQPRLKGVLTYCRFQSLKLVAHFSRIASALNQAQIPFVLLKGGAMKVYRPDFPRWMGDIDILVERGDFDRAEKVAEKLGYTPFRSLHSVDFRLAGTQEGIVDLHRYIEMHTGREEVYNRDLVNRSHLQEVFSAQGLLPCREDMVFISLVNLYKNLADHTSTDSVLNTFYDLHYLIDNPLGFDWTLVRENAGRTGTDMQIWLAASFVASVFPKLFPPELLSGWVDPEEADVQCVRLLYRREVLSPLREEIGEFNVCKAFRQIRPLGGYLGKRARFFFLKRLKGVQSQMQVLRHRGFMEE